MKMTWTPEWIPTRNGLPAEGERVLISGPHENDYANGRFTTTAEFSYGQFLDTETGDDFYWPSHWMALPPPPSDE
jgi:hypothetical protein